MEFFEYHTRLAAYVLMTDVVDGEERVLLAWWNGEGHSEPEWSLPGGGIDFEESISDGAVREVTSESPSAVLRDLLAGSVSDVPGLTVTRPSLEDVYLQLVGPSATASEGEIR